MYCRLFKPALVLAGAVVLAACEGTLDTQDAAQSEPAASGTPVLKSSTDDSRSSQAEDASSTSSGLGASSGFQGHPLDDPASPLADRTVYFAFDKSEVLEPGQAIVDAHARYLAEHSGASILLEGHADERGTREYNIALGERRAQAVRKRMTLHGAAAQQIRTVSHGEERPAQLGHDETAWRLNRRVEISYQDRE